MPVSWPSARARIPVHSGGCTVITGAFKVEERGGGSDQSDQVFEEGLHWPLEAGRSEVILCPRAPWRNVALLMPWLGPVRPILDFYLKLEVIYSCVSLKIWPKCCSVVTIVPAAPAKDTRCLEWFLLGYLGIAAGGHIRGDGWGWGELSRLWTQPLLVHSPPCPQCFSGIAFVRLEKDSTDESFKTSWVLVLV